MDGEAGARVDVASVLRAAAAAVFLLVAFLANPGGRDGIIATAGVYGLVETSIAAATLRGALPKLARVATLALAVLVLAVGILPLLTPGTAAIVIPITLALWFLVVCLAVIRTGERTRRLAAGAALLCAAASLVSIALAPAIELRLLACTACLCGLVSGSARHDEPS